MSLRNSFQEFLSPQGGKLLGIGLLAQAQPNSIGGLPIWVLLVGALLVIIFAVIWVLYEESKQAETQVTAPSKTREAAAEQLTDDLTRIEGIGPKISGLLQAVGITTFAKLAETEIRRLRQIVRDANISMADPSTWPEQARLAANGDWERLQTFQDELKGGRRV